MVEFLGQYNIITVGIIGSILAGVATGIGALPIFFTRKVPDVILDGLLGFAAGVMLAATAFSLIIPAIEYGGGGVQGAVITSIGIFIGAVFLDLIDKFSPHMHRVLGEEGGKTTLNKIWLFIIAITIHNFPEGLAVGVGFGSGNIASGMSLAIGIGLQNIPEGLAVALALLRENYSRTKVFFIALATGLVEPIGGLLGISIIQVAKPILPIGLAFAAGAMLFVISDEIIPETHTRGYQRIATYGVIIGFIIMMIMDTTLG
ncbi:MAG: zinc transporter, family [Clostridiales bacterium]|jgi:ZIP family zinc transporter|nr:zinc transporter, family [Clostridiales bacterium]MDK2933656.1 zinc transporter, family [Clostridiales bacterium]